MPRITTKLTCAFAAACLLVATVLVPSVHADVKTRTKTLLKLEGMLGRIASMAGGAAAKDGLTETVAVKGHRKSSFNSQTGQIVDLSEEKIYNIDFKKKEYRVMTFAALREQLQKAQADAAKAAKDMPAEDREQLEEAGKDLEVTFEVRATGETRAIAGHQAKQMILTVAVHQKGKTLDESGGMVLTNEIWLGPRIAALQEVSQFDQKFFAAVYGDSLAAMGQQFVSLAAMYPSLEKLVTRMGEEAKKLDGTPLLSIQKTEAVKSEAAMAQAPAAPSSGGGLSGALARRMAGNRGKPEKRSLLYTATTETEAIDTTASEADVAVPAGFKEKK
jgi:hypothetical protein